MKLIIASSKIFSFVAVAFLSSAIANQQHPEEWESELNPLSIRFNSESDSSETDFSEYFNYSADKPINTEGCEEDGHFFPDYETCGVYYRCFMKENKWTRETLRCPDGQSFFEDSQVCKKVDCLARDPWPETPAHLPCGVGSQYKKFQFPGDCHRYYTCIWTGSYFFSKSGVCTKSFFSERTQSCQSAYYCPQDDVIKPPGWKCDKAPYKHLPHPNDCTKYYGCYPCDTPDGSDRIRCVKIKQCPVGQFFDDTQRKCILAKKCPRENAEVPPETGWHCQNEGEINVHPIDCGQYYTCKKCSNPGGWCFETTKCPEGELFDEVRNKCVPSQICPNEWIALPVDWDCSMEGEKNVVPGTCQEYYTCTLCDRQGGWCYTRHPCPAHQVFNKAWGYCEDGKCPLSPELIPDDFICSEDGEIHVHPVDCSHYYKCEWTGNYFTWTGYECPNDLNFDEIRKTCVSGTCPQTLIEIGTAPGWKCKDDRELAMLPGDCSKYYECIPCSKPREWCYQSIESCPEGHSFDNWNQRCVNGGCLYTRPEVEGWECFSENEQHVYPDDCTKYYTCHNCSNKRNGWCLDENECPQGQFYDDTNKLCIATSHCPQQSLQKLPPGWNCTGDGELHVVPTDCSSFYTCASCKDGPWCHTGIKICPLGQTFDDTNKMCVQGTCKQLPEILPLPPSWTCKKPMERHVNPTDCSSYYTCVVCPEVLDSWCYTLEFCGDGENFDDRSKKCVPGKCPQGRETICETHGNCTTGVQPKLPQGPGWTCMAKGEEHVFPTDCSSYYICHHCKKSKGWCYERKQCQEWHTYDESKKMCVLGRCPQWPDKLPEGWRCNEENEFQVHPLNCRMYYKCIKCPEGGWCYELAQCPLGMKFDRKKARSRKIGKFSLV